ncbi:MAG: YDG domain-containing protein, partial [bacterium]|nr:YDG domain-containing protein [bacterium]
MNYELENLAMGDIKKLFSLNFGKKGASFLVILSMVLSISTPLMFVPAVANAAATEPDLQVSKTNNVSGTATVGSSFNWVITITNPGTKFANFTASTQTVLKDELPTSGATYGTPSIVLSAGINGTLGCSVALNTLTCLPNSSALKINPGDTITITLPVTVTASGTLNNPRSGGSCAVDSDIPDNVEESNETNNNCNLGSSNSVIVSGTPVTPSVTATSKVYDGTTTATTSCSLTGVESGDDVTCSAANSDFDNKNVGTGKTVTATGITLGGANAGEYTLTSTTATTTANITTRPITVTAVTDTKVFDSNTSSDGVPTITVGSLASGDTAT